MSQAKGREIQKPILEIVKVEFSFEIETLETGPVYFSPHELLGEVWQL